MLARLELPALVVQSSQSARKEVIPLRIANKILGLFRLQKFGRWLKFSAIAGASTFPGGLVLIGLFERWGLTHFRAYALQVMIVGFIQYEINWRITYKEYDFQTRRPRLCWVVISFVLGLTAAYAYGVVAEWVWPFAAKVLVKGSFGVTCFFALEIALRPQKTE